MTNPEITREHPVPSIVHGSIMKRPAAEALTRQSIPRRAFDYVPQGSRLIVVKDKVQDKVGSIVLAEVTREGKQAGTGWIIGAGPEAGLTKILPIGNTMCEDSGDLLGLHIMYGFHTGKAIRYSIFDTDYESQVVLITPADIWLVDYAADPWADTDDEILRQRLLDGQKSEAEAHEALAESRENRSGSGGIILPGRE